MNRHRSLWLMVAAAILMFLPLAIPVFQGDFEGTDGQAVEMIIQARPGYQPWFQPLWTPPSGEVESMLFAIQAALGAGFVGYVIGRRHGSSLKRNDHDGD
ncbi:MAG: energy-coupling factor ABC transporter substrate-binding protein [Magnetococcales bacterium]|nr:energy-coupling factor ABC transporter substrate-binding protein [Magnetococcales bacterium]MBF0151001.1 energy-coupling factor ABC transporter substrate-binding protein [Magnetococcales bacterium]MBF0172699.1 energy-coupling factor ABC transporter substrate-binding protein [Magnetococcales bacterium]MBF0347888.1 energy-coupling factor ABC transporter substrate-binding protein [Magnetococcales bacterium]MBF0629413.1 energy-coupling factor ABC transporter substrate-binding protein [Magnetococ